MSGYVSYPISSTPDEILATVYSQLKEQFPNWVENDGNLDTWILQVMASQASDLRTLASDVPDTIFRYFGANLVGLTPISDTPAVANTTWTMTDNLGHTIPAGTQVSILDSAGNANAFVTQVDAVIPNGSTATAAGAVQIAAVQPGSAASGLGSAGLAITLIDTLAFVASVVLTGATAGGQDAETTSDYNSRLAAYLQTLSTRPILPSDFSTAAKNVVGVYRAVALDGYDPAGGGTYGNQREVSIAAVDINGAAIAAPVKTSLDSYLQSVREINFIVNVIDPHFTNIDVSASVKAASGFDHAALQSAVTAAIQSFLSPASWGRDPAYTDATGAQTWIETTTLRYNKLLQAITVVTGIDYVVSATDCIHSGVMGTADINLTAPAALTTAGTINVTVS